MPAPSPRVLYTAQADVLPAAKALLEKKIHRHGGLTKP